jgi:hypothetical protein
MDLVALILIYKHDPQKRLYDGFYFCAITDGCGSAMGVDIVNFIGCIPASPVRPALHFLHLILPDGVL